MENKDAKKEIVPLELDQLNKVTGGTLYGYNFCPICGRDLRGLDDDKAASHLNRCKAEYDDWMRKHGLGKEGE